MTKQDWEFHHPQSATILYIRSILGLYDQCQEARESNQIFIDAVYPNLTCDTELPYEAVVAKLFNHVFTETL